MSNSLERVARSTYARLLAEFIAELEEPHRFLVLGFEETLGDLAVHFQSICSGVLVRPTGKLQEMSALRKILSPCLIALDWTDVGKYASWTTSFKILTESPLSRRGSGQARADVYDPIDLMIWLSRKDDILEQMLKYISEELPANFKPKSLEAVKQLLGEIRYFIQNSRSLAEWFHPQRFVEAIVFMVQRQELSGDADFGSFFRSLGMEPFSDFCSVPFFGENIFPCKAFRRYLKRYQQILRSYLIAPYEKGAGKLRESLSNVGMNLVRHLLVKAVEREVEEPSAVQGKWVGFFLDFEDSKVENGVKRRKYVTNPYGLSILNRSMVSGLPTAFQFCLVRSKDFGGDNILLKFFHGELKALVAACNDISRYLDFNLSTVKMLDDDTLIVEFAMQNSTAITVDTYVKGLKAPHSKINNLLARFGGE